MRNKRDIKLIKLGKVTTDKMFNDGSIEDDGFLHLPASINALTLCGIGEEEFADSEEVNGKLNCPRCLEIVNIVKKYLNKQYYAKSKNN